MGHHRHPGSTVIPGLVPGIHWPHALALADVRYGTSPGMTRSLTMAIRMEKPWIDLTAEAVKALPGQLGVYQLADAAAASSISALPAGAACSACRSELQRALRDRPGGAVRFRTEVNQQYTTRHQSC